MAMAATEAPAAAMDHTRSPTDPDRSQRRALPPTWRLGGRPELEHLRFRAWAHTLGFRGHWLTKSRAYSTTFAALRAARHDWHTDRHHPMPSPEQTAAIGAWRFVG
jgi:hypothetical protein